MKSLDTNEIINLVTKYVGNGFAYKVDEKSPQYPYPLGLEEYHPTIAESNASTGNFHVETLFGIDVDSNGIYYYIRMKLGRNTRTSWGGRVRPIIESLKFRRIDENKLLAEYKGNSEITKTIITPSGQTETRRYKLVTVTAILGATQQGKLNIKETLIWIDTVTNIKYQSAWGWRDYRDGR